MNCSSLTSITIPESVTSIGYQAFDGCTSLMSVTVNTNIDRFASIFGTQVTEYILGNDVTNIGYEAFKGCSALTSISIPNSVTSIGRWAFEGCSSLTSITIPESVTSLEYQAFDGCSSLETINYTGTKKQWENITKNIDWKVGCSIKTIVCSDKKVKVK